MINSDVFVIARHDQFQKHGYQRRVTMRERWCSHQLVGKPSLIPITQVQVAPDWQQRLTDVIRGRYQGSPYFGSRGAELIERITAASGTSLDEVNLSLIEAVRSLLGITTPLAFTDPPPSKGAARLIWQCHQVDASTYLSGSGGTAYLGEEAPALFAANGIDLTFSRHQARTGDSIVSILMDADDPHTVIRASNP